MSVFNILMNLMWLKVLVIFLLIFSHHPNIVQKRQFKATYCKLRLLYSLCKFVLLFVFRLKAQPHCVLELLTLNVISVIQ